MASEIGGDLRFNRSRTTEPVSLLGRGWSIWKGPAAGDGLSGKEDQDERSLDLNQLDLPKIQLVTCLKEGETSIRGEEKLKRLKETGHVRLDAKIFQTLWENKQLIPEGWKEKTSGCITSVFFGGTILRSPSGRHCVLCLYWLSGEWIWDYDRLGRVWYIYNPSATLVSQSLGS